MRLRSLSPALLLLAMLAAAQPARAQEPAASHLAAARELVVVGGAYGSLERVLPEITEEIKRQVVTRPELAKDLTEVLRTLQPEFDLQRDVGVGQVARAYAKNLTEPEIREVLAFFKSPVGAKYIKIQPDLTDDLVAVMTNWSQNVGEYAQTRVRAEMQKRGHQMQ